MGQAKRLASGPVALLRAEREGSPTDGRIRAV